MPPLVGADGMHHGGNQDDPGGNSAGEQQGVEPLTKEHGTV